MLYASIERSGLQLKLVVYRSLMVPVDAPMCQPIHEAIAKEGFELVYQEIVTDPGMLLCSAELTVYVSGTPVEVSLELITTGGAL